MGVTSGAETAYNYISEAHEIIQYLVGLCCSILVFYVVFCRSLFVLLAIALSVLCFTASDYPFGIFKFFFFLISHFLNEYEKYLLNGKGL